MYNNIIERKQDKTTGRQGWICYQIEMKKYCKFYIEQTVL